MNLLAINLANDIVTGKRSVEEARAFYAETAMAFMKGQLDPYVEGSCSRCPKEAWATPISRRWESRGCRRPSGMEAGTSTDLAPSVQIGDQGHGESAVQRNCSRAGRAGGDRGAVGTHEGA